MDLPRRSLRAPLSSFARVAARSRPARCNATQNGEHLESAAERAAAGCAGVLRGANLTVRGALRSWRLCETAEAVSSSWPPDPASWGGAHQRVRPTLRAGTHRDQSWCSCDAISFAFCPFITHAALALSYIGRRPRHGPGTRPVYGFAAHRCTDLYVSRGRLVWACATHP